ncbi:hypothetical protein BAJUN_00460 [Bajunvirus bajun]|uniref:Uncharacterized protein n=1 Tax=Brevundimonas phage vB_BgoS-Bajun TaxID=2948594 RepID=A0A9E7ST72_9CAUD|nr:hypothetical protein BAJUN_00460 [Brevundimonas phage vB_BgoS-Bajun]
MTVKDSPITRIKAADAKALWVSGPRTRAAALQKLAKKLKFQFLVSLHLNETDATRSVEGWAESPRSREIATDYFAHILKAAPGEVLERTGVLIYGVHKDGTAEVATYGTSRTDCHILGTWGAEKLNEMTAVPFQSWFGMGNDGVPLPLTEEQLETLTPEGRTWVADRTRAA